jgi:hypothetical protein
MKKLNLFIITLFSLAILTACSKEMGCTDIDSVDYDSLAEEDDGSCTYEGNAVLWYNQAAATGLVNDGATSLTYYVDGQIVGSSAASVYWTSSPDCSQNGSVTITENLGNVKTQAYTYSVRDQTGFEYWNGIINFNANTCLKLQLSFKKKK